MRYFTNIVIIFLISIMTLFSGCARKEKKEEIKSGRAVQPSERIVKERQNEEQKIELRPIIEGIITFLSGIVKVNRGEGWSSVDVEDVVQENNIIKTKENSFCEIQFMHFAVVRVQENSEITVKNVLLKENSNNVKLDLFNGKLLCKVNNLKKGESFIVHTKTALCAVRGTEFLIITDEKKATIAVKKGEVRVVPEPIAARVEKIKEVLKSETAKVVVEELKLPEIIVPENREMSISKEEVKKIEEDFEKIIPVIKEKVKQIDDKAVIIEKKEKEIEEIGKTKSEKERRREEEDLIRNKSEIEKLKTSITEMTRRKSEEIQKVIKKPLPVSKNIIRELDELKKLKPREVLPAEEKKPGNESTFRSYGSFEKTEKKTQIIQLQEKPIYTKININVKPSDSIIVINDEDSGIGRYSGLFEPGTRLLVVVKKEGFEEIRKEIIVTKIGVQNIELELLSRSVPEKVGVIKKDENFSIKTEDEKGQKRKSIEKIIEKPVEQKRVSVREKVQKIETKVAKPSSAFQPQEMLEKSEKEGPVEQRKMAPLNRLISKEKEARKEEKPEALARKAPKQEEAGKPSIEKTSEPKPPKKTLNPIVWSIKVSGERPVRAIVKSGNRFVFADRKGRLYAVDDNGNVLWNINTKNTENENSIPVIIENMVYFTGAREFLVIDLTAGKILKRIAIGNNKYSSHLFGRRVVKYNDFIIYPSNGALIFLNRKTLTEVKEIPIPEKSYATPSVYGDELLVLNQRGSILIIDPISGKVEEEIQTDALQPVSLGPSISEGKAYFAGRKGTVVAVDLNLKKVIWERKLQKGIFQDITIGKENVYPFDGEKFYKLSLDDGTPVAKPIVSSCSPLYYDGKLFYGRENGDFVVMDETSGKVLKLLKLDAPIKATPEISGNKIVICTENGRVYKINPEALNNEK